MGDQHVAIPRSGGSAFNSAMMDSKPPAEAPIPATGNVPRSPAVRMSRIPCRPVAARFFEDERSLCGLDDMGWFWLWFGTAPL